MSNTTLSPQNMEAMMMAALAGSVVDPTQFNQTDAGNALLFVAMHKEDIRYIEAWRTWAHWNGKRWELEVRHRTFASCPEGDRAHVRMGRHASG